MNTTTTDSLQDAISQVQHWRQQGRPDLAEQQLQAILSARPGEINATFMLAVLRREAGEFAQAIEILKPIIAAAPQFAMARLELASAQRGAGDFRAAIATLQALLQTAPNHGPAQRRLADTLIESGNLRDGRMAFAQAAQNDPFRPDLAAAFQAQRDGDFAKSETTLRGVLEKDPEHVFAIIGLSSLAMMAGQPRRAVELLDRAASMTPNLEAIWVNKARACFEMSDFEAADAAASRAVKLAPESAATWHLLGDIRATGFNPDTAPGTYLKAIELSPKDPALQLALGHAYKALGQRQDSEKAYRAALALNPNFGEAYWALADLKTASFTPEDHAVLERAFTSGEAPNPDQVCRLFALGKAREDDDRKSEAFEAYRAANAMQAALTPFDGEQFDASVDQIRLVIPLPREDATSPGEVTPIFIVGLPRSGSTLLEQILASHSQVEGTMELPHIPNYARELAMVHGSYGAALNATSDEELRAIGERYLSETAGFRTGKAYFIDKLPNNFLHIPLITRALPNAIIIDARRNPLDCGVSCFKQYFSKGQAFSYDLSTIGRFYRTYVDLMEFWSELVPGRIHTVIYESLVHSPDEQIADLLSACGLEFEEACLNFHQNKRVVRTASSEQVRQPINTGGIGRWREFEAHLGPLKEALGPELAAISEAS